MSPPCRIRRLLRCARRRSFADPAIGRGPTLWLKRSPSFTSWTLRSSKQPPEFVDRFSSAVSSNDLALWRCSCKNRCAVDALRRSRSRRLMTPRHLVSCRDRPRFSYPSLGRPLAMTAGACSCNDGKRRHCECAARRSNLGCAGSAAGREGLAAFHRMPTAPLG
jgi:hypothetical protein